MIANESKNPSYSAISTEWESGKLIAIYSEGSLARDIAFTPGRIKDAVHCEVINKNSSNVKITILSDTDNYHYWFFWASALSKTNVVELKQTDAKEAEQMIQEGMSLESIINFLSKNTIRVIPE